MFILSKLLYSCSLGLTVKTQQLSRKGTFYFVKLMSWTLQMKAGTTGLYEKQLKPVQLWNGLEIFQRVTFCLKTLMVISGSYTQKQVPGPPAKSEALVSHKVKSTQVQYITCLNAGKC